MWSGVASSHQLSSSSSLVRYLNKLQKILTKQLRRWHLHQVSYSVMVAWVTVEAAVDQHKDPGATDQGHLLRRRCYLVAHTEKALQRIKSCFAETAQLFWPEVSVRKIKVLRQDTPREEYRPSNINIRRRDRTKNISPVRLHGISSDAKIDRLGKANTSADWTNTCGTTNTCEHRGTKTSVYRAVVLTTLLFGSERFWRSLSSPLTVPYIVNGELKWK